MSADRTVNIPDGWERGQYQWGLVEVSLNQNTVVQCWKDGSITIIQEEEPVDDADNVHIPQELVDVLIKRLQETQVFSPYSSL